MCDQIQQSLQDAFHCECIFAFNMESLTYLLGTSAFDALILSATLVEEAQYLNLASSNACPVLMLVNMNDLVCCQKLISHGIRYVSKPIRHRLLLEALDLTFQCPSEATAAESVVNSDLAAVASSISSQPSIAVVESQQAQNQVVTIVEEQNFTSVQPVAPVFSGAVSRLQSISEETLTASVDLKISSSSCKSPLLTLRAPTLTTPKLGFSSPMYCFVPSFSELPYLQVTAEGENSHFAHRRKRCES